MINWEQIQIIILIVLSANGVKVILSWLLGTLKIGAELEKIRKLLEIKSSK